MEPRDERIFRHIALYRISIRAVIEHLFFEGKSCDDVINRLVSKEQLNVFKLPNRVSYYRLTLSAARARGVQENRASARGVQTRALRRALAVLWFCCMGERVRHRIERNTLTQLFGRAPGMGTPHCWEAMDDVKRLIYRVYTPGPNTPPDDVVRTIRLDAERAIADAKLAPLIVARRYVFAVLVENADRGKTMSKQLNNAGPFQVPVAVYVVPNIHDLAEAIRVHKTKRGLSNERSN
jgi:hypothetical protein